MFRCEECGWQTLYGRIFALELACFECGGRLVKDDPPSPPSTRSSSGIPPDPRSPVHTRTRRLPRVVLTMCGCLWLRWIREPPEPAA